MRGLFDPGIGVDHFHSNPPSVGACASLFPCATYCMALSFLTIYRPAGWLYYKLCRIYDMDTASPPATELWLDHHQFLSDYYTLVSSFLSVVGLYFYTSQHDGSLFFHTTVGQSFISDFFFFFTDLFLPCVDFVHYYYHCLVFRPVFNPFLVDLSFSLEIAHQLLSLDIEMID